MKQPLRRDHFHFQLYYVKQYLLVNLQIIMWLNIVQFLYQIMLNVFGTERQTKPIDLKHFQCIHHFKEEDSLFFLSIYIGRM